MSCEELEIVWNNIKAEARTLADCEPMLASFYHATLLKHENLGSALSYMLANKLSSPIMPAIATVLAVMSVAQTINPKRRRVTFSPSERASSSESVSKFMRQRRKNRGKEPMRMIGAA